MADDSNPASALANNLSGAFNMLFARATNAMANGGQPKNPFNTPPPKTPPIDPPGGSFTGAAVASNDPAKNIQDAAKDLTNQNSASDMLFGKGTMTAIGNSSASGAVNMLSLGGGSK